MDKRTEDYCRMLREMGPAKFAETFWQLPTGLVKLRLMQKIFLDAVFENLYTTKWFILSAMKKLGKTFVNSVFVLWKTLAFPGCISLLHSNSLSQSAVLVFREITDMINNDPYLKANCHMTQREIVFLPTGSKITCLAISGAANAGGVQNLLSSSESWGISSDLEIENFMELNPGPLKILDCPAQVMVDSYAGELVGSETFHDMVDHGLTLPCISEEWQIYKGERVLMMHLTGEDKLRQAWHGTEQELEDWIADNHRTKSPGKAKAHLFNERSSGEFGIPDELWLPCFDPDHQPLLPTKSKVITLSLDAASKAKTGDDVALTGWYLEDGLVKLALHKLWKGKDRIAEQKFEEIFDYVIWLAKNWQVSKVLYDEWQLISLSQRWRDSGLVMQKVAQSKQQMGLRGSKYLQALREKRVVMYDHPDLRTANRNVKLVDQKDGGVLVKKGSTATIDYVVSSVMGVSELADFSTPVPPEVLARAMIELHQESAWRGQTNWTTGIAGTRSKFRSPDRR